MIWLVIVLEMSRRLGAPAEVPGKPPEVATRLGNRESTEAQRARPGPAKQMQAAMAVAARTELRAVQPEA